MSAFRKSVFSFLVLACSVTSAGARDADIASRAKAKAIHAQIQRQPMIFFVAKGGVDACGPGCSEWIAAEGPIDDDAGQRFRDFLKRLPRADLPVFFNSSGGVMAQALVLGTLLREHRMTVGIGRTLAEGCGQTASIDASCRRLIQSKREHRARLVTDGARCFSACVQAFTGGSVRLVARDAQLGIHANRQFMAAPQGGIPGVVDVQAVVKRYMVEMGVDPGLVDAAAEINADRIRILSRAEIARVALETRGSYETRWLTHQAFERMTGAGFPNQFSVLKSMTETTGADGKEYRTSELRISCIGGDAAVWLIYEREPSPKEVGSRGAVRVAAGANEYALQRSEIPASLLQSVAENNRIIGRLVLEIGQAKNGSEQQNVAVTWEFLRSAAAAPSIVITESFVPQGSGSGSSRVVKFSTDGLLKALGHLQKNCSQAKVL